MLRSSTDQRGMNGDRGRWYTMKPATRKKTRPRSSGDADAHRLVSFISFKGCIAEVKREKPKKRISFGRQSRLKKVANVVVDDGVLRSGLCYSVRCSVQSCCEASRIHMRGRSGKCAHVKLSTYDQRMTLQNRSLVTTSFFRMQFSSLAHSAQVACAASQID